MTTKVTAYVPKTFNDAGTGEIFEGDKEHPFDAGAFENYNAAGLIGKPPAPAKGDAEPPKKP